MDRLSYELNTMLIDTFRTILKVEGSMLKRAGRHNISISEIHMLEAIGKTDNDRKTISDIAQDLGITLSSVTIAVNKLVKKGFVEKNRAAFDGRAVHVSLTPFGRRVDQMHHRFHEKMIVNVTQDMDESQRQALLQGVAKLNEFFRQKLNAMEE